MIKDLKQIFSGIGCNPFYVSTLSTVSTWSKNLSIRVKTKLCQSPQPSPKILFISVNVIGKIYRIYEKLSTLWIIKNLKQIFKDNIHNPFYV